MTAASLRRLPGRSARVWRSASLSWRSTRDSRERATILLDKNETKTRSRLTWFSPGHTFRHKTAGAFGPDLAKKLSQLVKMEKNVMRSMELVSRERMEVAVSLYLGMTW